MFDLITLLLSMGGIALSLFYILNVWCYNVDTHYDSELESSLVKWLRSGKNDGDLDYKKLNIVLKDYETTSEEMGRRDSITLIVGTILITSSLITLGNAATIADNHPIYTYAVASIGLFSIWLLLLHDTTKKVNSRSYERIKAIEQALNDYFKHCLEREKKEESVHYDFGIHSYIEKRTRASNGKDKPVWWLCLRRTFWGMILLLLSIAWLLLSII